MITTILIYSLFNLVAAAASYPAGYLSDKIGRKYVLLSSFFLFMISLMGFAVTKNVFVFAGLFALYGIYSGIFRAVGNAFAGDFVLKEERASGIGLFNSVYGLSGLAASIIAGLIYDKIGHATVFATAAVFVFLGAMALLMFDAKRVTIK